MQGKYFGRNYHALLSLSLLLGILLFIAGCAEVPITQRKSLRLVPESRIANIKEYIREALPYYEKSLK